MKFIDDKIEQRMTGYQISARQCQDVALQPPGKRAKVLGEPGDEQAVLTASTGVGEAGFEGFAFRAYTAGDACAEIDEGFELLMDVEHVAMTRKGALLFASMGPRMTFRPSAT